MRPCLKPTSRLGIACSASTWPAHTCAAGGPRFRGDLLITDHIGLDDLVTTGYHGLLYEKDKHVKMLVKPE